MKANIPNMISYSRIILSPIFMYLLLSGDNIYILISGLIFFIAAISDYFDGWYARKYKVVSDYGVFLDPLAHDEVMAYLSHTPQLVASVLSASILNTSIIDKNFLHLAGRGCEIKRSGFEIMTGCLSGSLFRSQVDLRFPVSG